MNPTCHACGAALVRSTFQAETLFSCGECQTHVIGLGAIERYAEHELAHAFAQKVAARLGEVGHPCAQCRRPSLTIALLVHGLTVPLDVCTTCRLVRFDHGELEQLPRKARYRADEVEAATRIAQALVVREQERRSAAAAKAEQQRQKKEQQRRLHRSLLALGLPGKRQRSAPTTFRWYWLLIALLLAGLAAWIWHDFS